MGSNILLSPSFIRSSMGILRINRKQQINADVVMIFFHFIRRLRSSIFIFDVPPLVIAKRLGQLFLWNFLFDPRFLILSENKTLFIIYNLEQQIYNFVTIHSNFVMYKMRIMGRAIVHMDLRHFLCPAKLRSKLENPFDYWWRPWCRCLLFYKRALLGTFRNAY
jgi:hypothetical protein